MKIALLSPKGPLYRNRGGIFKKSLRYQPLTLTTLAVSRTQLPIAIMANLGYRYYAHHLETHYTCDWPIGFRRRRDAPDLGASRGGAPARRRLHAHTADGAACRYRGAVMRHITFVRPNLGEGLSADAMTPLVFAILKARTPRDIATTLIDERVEPFPWCRPIWSP